MKYLRIYEGFGSPQYEMINREQFTNESHKFINFSCMDKMLKLLKPFTNLVSFGGTDSDGNILTAAFTFFITEYQRVDMDIYEMDDEWFIVKFYDDGYGLSQIYKCDQFGGIVKLLKDKKIID